MNHVTNNGNQCGHVKNAKPSMQLATMSCEEEEGCYTHPKVSQMAQKVRIWNRGYNFFTVLRTMRIKIFHSISQNVNLFSLVNFLSFGKFVISYIMTCPEALNSFSLFYKLLVKLKWSELQTIGNQFCREWHVENFCAINRMQLCFC